MGDRMRAIPFSSLVNWLVEEYAGEKRIFGIDERHFYRQAGSKAAAYGGEELSSPLGPAAGPHTQLAQNLASAYLTGGRFFELKTVQVIDRLSFPKPCINAEDECYNTEWSTELSIEEAFNEYVKGWFLIHLLSKEFFQLEKRSFVFNMSVGYDLEGIRSAKVDNFIEGMKDASSSAIFEECRKVLKNAISRFKYLNEAYIDRIEAEICNSIALSTMHGCPPAEIEAICKYLMLDKKLHTHVKLNPTLLGYDFVRTTLDKMAYDYISIKEETFTDDLRYEDALPLLQRLIELAGEHDREFGIKLSNTLPVLITGGELTGDMMYMSGKPLYALTINLAHKLAVDFRGAIKISYSGGADRANIAEIIATGIEPVTVATTLLKPNGYQRLKQLAEIIEPGPGESGKGLDLIRLKNIAAAAVLEPAYHKKAVKEGREKPYKELPLFDCRASCGICVAVCPNRANIRVMVDKGAFKYKQQILHIDGMCNECGNCATFCPEAGKPYLDKLTLYWNEEDFTDSSNCGFLRSADAAEKKITIRVDNVIKSFDLSEIEKQAGQLLDPDLLEMIGRVCKGYQYLFLDYLT